MDHNQIDQVAFSAVKKAGQKLLELLKSEIKYEMKSSRDILAEGDLLSEKIIVEEIKKSFPDHGFLSEELGRIEGSEYKWIIDPIDGTINFARSLDDFCISLALTQNDTLELGLVYQPTTGKLYFARNGKGAYLNNSKLTVSTVNDLTSSLLATDNSSKLDSRQENFALLQKICQEVRHTRIYGSGALHLALVAEGKIDVYFKTRSNYWDYAAGILLVQEAGGTVTDFTNLAISEKSKNILATNKLLHQKFLDLV